MADEHDLIIQQLGLHPSATRIKKLLIYACHNRWESDSQKIMAIDWQSLVQTLQQLNPTPEHLRARLDALVGTLNKQADYLPVADIISQALAQFYPSIPTALDAAEKEIPTQIDKAMPMIAKGFESPSALQAKAIQALEQEPDRDRIKKLLNCATRHHWETDLQKLASLTIADLVTELQMQQPTLVNLQATLSQVVQNLSKPVEYRLVADIIVKHMSGLFREPSECPAIECVLPKDSFAALTIPNVLPATVSQNNQTAMQRARESTVGKPLDLFDLRLEVMKATNPLRAKILMFSILYYDFNFQTQDWANLRLYSLDGLIRSVLSVCDTWDALECNLQDAAQRQHEPDAYVDSASAVLKCLKPAYAESRSYLQQVIKIVSVADATHVIRHGNEMAIEISEDATEIRMNEDATVIESAEKLTSRWHKEDVIRGEPNHVTEILTS